MGDEMKYSEGQRNQIYEKYLRPLKLKISQILLYDTNAAADFLKKYNNLLQKTSDSELLDKITELELEIEQYEKTLGKEKTFQDKSSIIIGQVEELLYESEQFTLEDFEKEVHSLVQRYKENFSGYSLEERDLLEAKIYELQARLIFKRVNQEYPEKIDIPKEDEIGIMIYLNREITRLQQSKNPKIKNYVEKIKYELMGGTEAIHNSEIWKVLSYAQRERFEEKEENHSKSKSLIYAKAKNNSVVNAKNRSIFSIFRKEPQIPLTERDLAKISIDWLAKYIPKDMLQELEADRNKEEDNIRDKEYLPDPKAPIYEMIKSVTRFGIPNRKDYVLQDENGSKIYIFIEDHLSSDLYWTSIVMEAGSIKVVKNYSTQLEFKERGAPRHLNAILNLAQIIDRCFNTDFQQQLLKEVKEVKRARLTEYAAAKSSAEYHAKQNGEHGVWQYKVDLALPCATQNELDLEDAKMLVANGVTSVTEGANMPTTLEATKYLQEKGVLFVGGKAANAGGVATSALEMSQNSERLSWTFEEVDGKLKGIMETIYANISDAAKRYNATVGGQTDYVAGANIAGFEKVVDAMLAQGVC